MAGHEYLHNRAEAVQGAIVTALAQTFRVIVLFTSGILLARLLSPTDFGLIAMISTCFAFVALVQDLGLNQATIQRPNITRAQMSALFWVSVGSSVLLGSIAAGLGPAIALFFGDHRLSNLSIAYSIIVVLTGLYSQQQAIMTREMRFNSLAVVDVASATSSAVAAVTVAWITASYWALFAGSFASALVSLAFIWTTSGWRPGRPSFQGEFASIIGFGSGVSGFNIVNYFSRNADNLLLGRFWGAEQLGLYDRAYRLLLFPLVNIQGPLGRVMLPLLSRLACDPQRYRTAYTDCVSSLLMIIHPPLICAIVFADDVFSILLGPQWVPAAPIFRWLGIAGLHQVMTSSTGWLFLSQARGGEIFRFGVYTSTTTVASFLIGLPWGAIGIAAAYTVSEYLLRLPVIWAGVGRRGPVSTSNLYAIAAPHMLAIFIVAGILSLVGVFIPAIHATACLSLVALSYVIYLVIILLFPSKRTIMTRNFQSLVNLKRAGWASWTFRKM